MDFICPTFIFGLAMIMIVMGLAKATEAKSRKARLIGRLICIFGALLLVWLAFAFHQIGVDEGLVQAVHRGGVEDVKRMLSLGASPDASFESGPPAIEIAKQNGHDAIVKILREAGAKE
jgi:hypothetical protein